MNFHKQTTSACCAADAMTASARLAAASPAATASTSPGESMDPARDGTAPFDRVSIQTAVMVYTVTGVAWLDCSRSQYVADNHASLCNLSVQGEPDE